MTAGSRGEAQLTRAAVLFAASLGHVVQAHGL